MELRFLLKFKKIELFSMTETGPRLCEKIAILCSKIGTNFEQSAPKLELMKT